MNIYPAIDIKSGACVRLFQGQYDQVTVYADNPLQIAHKYVEEGAKYLHVVDLDGARQGHSINHESIISIARATDLHIQYGGGIRTREQIQYLLAAGIDRIVLGSIAILQPDKVKKWLHEFGQDRITLALDVRIDANDCPLLAVSGWEQSTAISLWDLLTTYNDTPLKHLLCTDIQRDGTLSGVNFKLYAECLRRYPTLHFQASGGVSSLKDLQLLSTLPIAGVVIGKALYENNFSLKSALAEVAAC